MPARTESTDQRWRFNHSGQLVDADASNAGWELADEIVRLKIAEVSGNADDIVTIRTPPKQKLVSGPLVSDSPLDTASNPSAESSPDSSGHAIDISHSRGSSIDTASSVASNKHLNSHGIKSAPATTEAKERPHSFGGGLSSTDLRRLQNAGEEWVQSSAEQTSYPSLSHNHLYRPQPQQHPSMHDIRNRQTVEREDLQPEYIQPRNYNAPVPPPPFIPATNGTQPMGYRQSNRNFQPQGLPGPSPVPYPAHTSHLSLGNSQQLYDMMLPGAMHENHHPAVNRVQQQHGVFRATHHHSASDPSSLRDAAALALLSGNMQFAPGMFQPPPNILYAQQYYGQDIGAQLMAAARVQPQYSGPYNVPAPLQQQQAPHPAGVEVANPISPSSTGTGGGQSTGPSANNRKLGLYKTELCRSWEEKGTCRYGTKCQFAHGEDELRRVTRHPKYKTEICRTFWVSGSCPYGKRCCFIHTELPSSGATPPAGGAPSTAESTSSQPDGRARSMSTNSDPNDATTSLLARIKNNNNGSPNGNNSGGLATPVEASRDFQFSRPPTGSLRVDTSVLDGSSVKQQNKSAYPTFASNGIMLPAPEAPVPVTAGPDLGRYNAARRDIVGYNGAQQAPKTRHGTRSNPRHSFSGEIDLNFAPSPSGGSYGLTSPDSTTPTNGPANSSRVNGHVRAGSAGNWSTLVRSNLANASFPHSGGPAGDIISSSPWLNDVSVGPARQWA